MKAWHFILAICILSEICFSQVRVAFIELKDSSGKTIEFEKDANFSHVAISYRGQWLHTHPYRGVEVISRQRLEEIGSITSIIEVSDREEPSEEFVNAILGSPYESKFSWESDQYYCSKLVGKVLGLKTEPMSFDAPIWSSYFKKYNGLPGLSPQGAFRQLLKIGHQIQGPALSCENIFQ